MHLHQKAIRALNLVGVQYRPHPRQARGRAVKAGEPHMNFAALEFHRVSRAFHNADDYTGIDRTC
jgi:hypothetical protein